MKCHATLPGAILLVLASALSYAQAPVPFINLPLVPDATAPGGPDFTLTVNGTGFVSNSVVNWNGTALATQFVSGSQLTATVPAADIATASTGWVTVVNPAPGGGTSSVAFFTVTAESSHVAFTLASALAAGPAPDSVVAGDFNGDGNLDLAVATQSSNMVSILLGDGKGNFNLASSAATGWVPWSTAVGDFNGDGELDLAVGNLDGDSVSILVGDGTGNFNLASSLATGWHPSGVAVGDFNGDGKLDLAVANNGGTVSILLGDGTGNFNLASSPAVKSAGSVAVGDFNEDGKLDLAVTSATGTSVSVLLGDGAGNFTLTSRSRTGSYPASVAVADFDGDGKPDLAVVNMYSDSVAVLLGDGTGNFTLTSRPATGIQPYSVTVGDFNGDGRPDLAVANGGDDTVSVLLGDGTGNFKLASSAVAGGWSVATGDFNGDGKLDMAVTPCHPLGVSMVCILLQVPASPAVMLSPTGLTFGTQLIGTTSDPQPVTLTNTGGIPLKISKIAAHGDFSQTNNCPSKVLPGGQCTINVAFVPNGRGTHTGSVTIRDNAADSPQTVSLTGVGTAITLLSANLDFGSQQVGTTSPPQVVTLTNYDPAAVNISRIRLTGSNAGAFAQSNTCGSSVPAGGSCTISVTFAPKYSGPRTATLEVDDNGGASPQTVALSGNGTR